MRARLIRSPRTWSFIAGACVTIAALGPPLHELSEQRLSAHMIQHELLMVVAAPLLVVGRPFVVMLWLLPRTLRFRVARFSRHLTVKRFAAAITQPFAAWLIHAIAIWVWHVPTLFEAAVRNDLVHVMQHASFFGTGLLFWWTVIHPARRAERGVTVVSLFTTAIHTSVLGAMMTFARAPWYGVYSETTSSLSPLADQQLAGMIMWIPASLAYLIGALWVARRWLTESDVAVWSKPAGEPFSV